MLTDTFANLSREQRTEQVRNRFQFKEGKGWFTPEGVFAGGTIEDVISALIDFEEAEINAIGDCMTGCCMKPPRLEDFVKKS